MILLSAHRDTVRNDFLFEYKDGSYHGLLDNLLGVLIVNSLFIENRVLCTLEKQKKIGVYFGDSEEWGTVTNMPVLKKDDIALVIDVAINEKYNPYDIAIENIYGFTKSEVTNFRESLEWEGFRILTKAFDGDPDDEDESWYWKKKGIKTMSFTIPIQAGGVDTGWHVADCSIEVEKVVLAQQILKRLINFLL